MAARKPISTFLPVVRPIPGRRPLGDSSRARGAHQESLGPAGAGMEGSAGAWAAAAAGATATATATAHVRTEPRSHARSGGGSVHHKSGGDDRGTGNPLMDLPESIDYETIMTFVADFLMRDYRVPEPVKALMSIHLKVRDAQAEAGLMDSNPSRFFSHALGQMDLPEVSKQHRPCHPLPSSPGSGSETSLRIESTL